MDTHEIKGAAKVAAGKTEQAYGRVKEKLTRTAEKLAGRLEQENIGAEGSTFQAWDLVQEYPGAAIGLSLLAGAGLGALLAYLAHD